MRFQGPLIVGGGPAGAAAAIVLARSGLRPVVLERHEQPHDAICGGFLSWSTARRLQQLGIDPAALGAHPVNMVRLVSGTREAETSLPSQCWSLSRRTLDQALLERAAMSGADVRRGIKAGMLDETGVVLADGTHCDAPALIIATGKHELRGAGREHASLDPAIGLRWRLPASGRLRAMTANTVELHLFAGGYAGLAIQEDGSGNLCIAMRRSLLLENDGDPSRLLERLAAANPALALRIDVAGGLPETAQAIANVPYGWIAKRPVGSALRIGDQAAVIPSLAGEGMAIALASGVAAGLAVRDGMDAARFQRRLARRLQFPVQLAGRIAGLAANPLGAGALVRAVGLVPSLSRVAARLSRVRDVSAYSIPPG